MKALALLIALIGVVAAEVFLDERFSDGGKKKIYKVFPFFPRYPVDGGEGYTCQG
jgi:hypothetical protein